MTEKNTTTAITHHRRHDFNPDEFQMSIGDHLEELRRRILFGLLGVGVAAVFCLYFGQRVVSIFCRPLIDALQKYNISPQIYTDQPADAFMVYIKISMISAASIAAPWMIYQLWQFVASGLYPNERKYVTKYVPLSITLLITGMLFVYFLVLPWSLQFFIKFTTDIPLTIEYQKTSIVLTPPTTQPSYVQGVAGNPPKPSDLQIWFDTDQSRLKIFIDGKVRVIAFGPDNLVATHFTLPDYLDLVLQLLITFGLAFQLPLVVLALARIGIVDIPQLKSFRRFVYLGLAVLAAALSPGDVVTATIALMVPLVLLYELGIFLAYMAEKSAAKKPDASQS
jgi:sec-independent protein translocase protein TatC